MRSIRRIASSVVTASLLTALVVEAAEAISDSRLPYEPVEVGDSGRSRNLSTRNRPLPSRCPDRKRPAAPRAGRVSPAGEALYSIPLDLPPGTNGLTPPLSLEYQHRMNSGAAGVGWRSAARRSSPAAADDRPGRRRRSGHEQPLDRFCSTARAWSWSTAGITAAAARSTAPSSRPLRGSVPTGPPVGPQYSSSRRRRTDLRVRHDRRLAHRLVGQRLHAAGLGAQPRAGSCRQSGGFRLREDAATGSYRLARVRYNGNRRPGVAATTEVAFTWENRPPRTRPRLRAGYRVLQPSPAARGRAARGRACPSLRTRLPGSASGHGAQPAGVLQECGRDAAQCLPPTTITWQDGAAGSCGAGVAMNLGAAPATTSRSCGGRRRDGDGRDDLVWSVSSTSA